ncbi:MAG: sodium:calcium antiporter [Chloroflexota bacterium]
MVFTLLLLLGSAALIYVGCEFFVNGIEWVGRKLGIAQNAVGTVLAAFGTALPESVVTFVAVVLGTTPEAKDIGVGAALGGPLVLSTVSYAATGCSILLFRRRRSKGSGLLIDGRRLGRDQIAFLAIFVLKVGLGFVAFPGKPVMGWVFLAAYAAYFWIELRQPSAGEEGELEPLRIRAGQTNPHAAWVFLQTGLALVAVFVGSQVFVSQLEGLAVGLGVPGHIVALLLSPVATELPETMNAIIWVRQGKQRLALANISGAMMIQATVPSALGLLFTPWRFDTALALAGATTMLSILYLILALKTTRLTASRLSFVGLGYVAFAAVFVATR